MNAFSTLLQGSGRTDFGTSSQQLIQIIFLKAGIRCFVLICFWGCKHHPVQLKLEQNLQYAFVGVPKSSQDVQQLLARARQHIQQDKEAPSRTTKVLTTQELGDRQELQIRNQHGRIRLRVHLCNHGRDGDVVRQKHGCKSACSPVHNGETAGLIKQIACKDVQCFCSFVMHLVMKLRSRTQKFSEHED